MSQTINVLFLAAEAEPFVKVGGLGDVAGTLKIKRPLSQFEIYPVISGPLSRKMRESYIQRKYDIKCMKTVQ